MPRTAAPILSSPSSPSSPSPIPRVADPDRRRTSASVVLRSVLEHGP
ncbi:sugar kinase, partial [Streptomyces nigra]